MNRPPIAVTGVGVVCAIGDDVATFADALRAGRCGIGPIEHLDTCGATCTIAGEVKRLPIVEAALPMLLPRRDRLALSAVQEALAASGLDPVVRDGLRVGVSVGTAQPLAHLRMLAEASDDECVAIPESVADAIATAFALRGPRVVASNACAASVSAITLARDHLWAGRADVMLAGGADALDLTSLAGFGALQSLDDRPCSPYGRSGGLSLGEGAAILVLETVHHARARGAPVLVELAGCGGSSDGYHPTAPDPTGAGAVLALRRGLAEAGLPADAVDYVNGHGTGTAANDAMERIAFTTVFGDRVRRLPVSSTKSMVGHTLGAAGAVEAAACVVAMVGGFVPPTANLPEPADPEFDFVPDASRPAAIDVAASTSYAFGGSNGALVFRTTASPPVQQPVPEEKRIVITGLGVVGALGEGKDAWIDALAGGRTGISKVALDAPAGVWRGLAAPAPKLDGRRYASRADWRRMNEFERMCAAAARLAWSDAALAPTRTERTNVAVVFATAAGALQDGVTFETALRAGAGAAHASPILFPHTAGNGAAGHVCTMLGLHGPMLSITQGGASGVVALQHGADLVRRGEVDVAIVLAGEELCGAVAPVMHRRPWMRLAAEAVRPYDERSDGTALGAAAVGLVLESAAHAAARGATGYAEILGVSSAGACGARR